MASRGFLAIAQLSCLLGFNIGFLYFFLVKVKPSKPFLKPSRVQESRGAARKPRDSAAVLFGLKFADNIHYKLNSSQASKAILLSSRHTGAKQNLTQNGNSKSFRVTCFWVSGKAITDKVILNTSVGLGFRRCSILPRIRNILRITVRFRTLVLVTSCDKNIL